MCMYIYVYTLSDICIWLNLNLELQGIGVMQLAARIVRKLLEDVAFEEHPVMAGAVLPPKANILKFRELHKTA